LTLRSTGFITPPTEEEEIYPYRRVWLSISLEMGILFGLAIALVIIGRFVPVPQDARRWINVGLALVPVALWLLFSLWRERFALQPRNYLLQVAVMTGLAASAISQPIINGFFQVDRWLPLESAISRIVGYTFTTGLIQALTIYLVLRLTVRPASFRTRLDGIAYGAASAVGYAAVLNLEFAWTSLTPPAITAMNIFDQSVILLLTGIVVGYGLVEVVFNRHPFPLLLTATIALASFITGIAIPLIAGFANTSISPLSPISSVSPIQGFLFAAGLMVAISALFNFLFSVAERDEQDVILPELEDIGP
jgi:RsiW-degrading membrane proteinase PrsW (M82 family)